MAISSIDLSTGVGLSSFRLYAIQLKSQKAPLTKIANDPQVKADIDAFTRQLSKLKSVDDFLKNGKLVNFVLNAFSLQSVSNETGIIKQVLTQDPTDKKSLANKLADPRWLRMAKALDFYHRGIAGLQGYTSTTSRTIQSGSITLNLNMSPNFKVGQQITFADAAHPDQNYMTGSVSAINGSSVTINVLSFNKHGSGTFNNWSVFANNPKAGGVTTPATDVVKNLKQSYITSKFEDLLGSQSTPAEEAAYFLRNAGKVTNIYQLLGDRVMLDVVEGALGIPKNIAVQPIAAQARLLQSQLNVKSLASSSTQPSNPMNPYAGASKTVISLAERYLSRQDALARSTSQPNYLITLFSTNA